MCGIVGLIDNLCGFVSPQQLEAMRDAMVSRGPDGEGQYLENAVGMAMRRLSVIDLAGGWQPFFAREGRVVVFQNGEIYNYRELRRELEAEGYNFSSDSDTEVLAHGFAHWGADGLLRRLDGMYALAILDRDSRELHLARDRFGEKPLFYALADGRFAYSSNLIVLAALSWVSDEIEPESVERYLALHYIPGDATLFKSIRRVLPGERLVVPIDDPVPQRYRYYSLSVGKEAKATDRELSEIIAEAVESRLVADVPVGVFLSGGLDSSLIAAVAARKQPRISTFSMGFNSSAHDESAFAAQVARSIGSEHHHFLFDEESFRQLLPKVVSALDEPVGDQALLPLYWLCQEARQHVTVVLSGEGADEIFAGYGYYRRYLRELSWREKLKSQFGRGSAAPADARRLINNSEPLTPSGFPLLTDIEGRRRLTGKLHTEPDEWELGLLDWLDQIKDSLRRATAADIYTWLPDDLLVKFDRMAMANSLEGRAPYLHPRVVEAGLRLPQDQRMDDKTSKIALRRIARGWLPREILDRPKQGFVLPMAKWLVQWFDAQPPVQDYFAESALPFLDAAVTADLVQQDLAVGVQRERLLFALVVLVEWYQSFKDRRDKLARRYKESAPVDAIAL